jgi:hypothetical protein
MAAIYPIPFGKEVTIKLPFKRNKKIVGLKVKQNKRNIFTLDITPIYEKDKDEPGLSFKPNLN